MGENGNGKTTLLRIIVGELAQSSGVFKYPALINPKKHNWYKIKNQIAYIPQDIPKWSGLLVDNLHFAAVIHGIKGKQNEDEVEFVLCRLGLYKYRSSTWNKISGGFKMRFALAKALVWNPKLLVLDELLKAITEVSKQVTDSEDIETVEILSEDANSLVKKATDDPKSSKVKTYLKRLEETATSLGKISTPILTIAKGISTLL